MASAKKQRARVPTKKGTGARKKTASGFEVYEATASARSAKKKGAKSPFSITVRFRGGLNAQQ